MVQKTADTRRPQRLKTVRTSSSINDVKGLREHALIALDRLQAYEISVEEAGVIGKLCESVMSTVKTELAYAAMLGTKPDIAFLKNDKGEMSAETPKLNEKGLKELMDQIPEYHPETE